MSQGNKDDAFSILPRLLIIDSEADIETPIPPGGWMRPLYPMLPAAVPFSPEVATWLLVTFLENWVAAFRAEDYTTRLGECEPESHLSQAGIGDEQVAPMWRGRRQGEQLKAMLSGFCGHAGGHPFAGWPQGPFGHLFSDLKFPIILILKIWGVL